LTGKKLDPLDTAIKFSQDCVKRIPVILLGSGASAAYGIPGMWPLGEYLSKTKLPVSADALDTEAWGRFLAALPLTNLEQALTDVSLSSRLTRHVVENTWDYLSPFDLDIFEKICADRTLLSLTKLFRFLFKSTAREVNVVTPNYDRLAEYAANAGGYAAYSGFTFGAVAQRAAGQPPKVYEGNVQTRTVNVWKVHGSFGWFSDKDGIAVGLPPIRSRPAGMEPIIITPGIEKYRRTHDEPYRTIMQCADKCIRNAAAYLCVGYGFNDQHLQTLLVERCQYGAVPLVLITQKVSDTALNFLRGGKCQQYMALEQNGDATRMYCNDFPDGIDIPASKIWSLEGFLQLVM
jgi:hypothetical protein